MKPVSNSYNITCGNPDHPIPLVPSPIHVGSKIWCVMHRPTGKLVNIKLTDSKGQVILDSSEQDQTFWIGHSEEQAKAQAAFLGDEYCCAFFVCTGETT